MVQRRAVKLHPAAGAYARALLAVADEHGLQATFDGELKAVAELLGTGSPKIFFESPKIPHSEKKQVLDRAFAGKVSEQVLNLLKILVDRGRQDLLGQIVDSFSALYDEVLGRVHVTLGSAVPIDESARQRIVATLSAKLGKEIIDDAFVDESLLGGLTIRVGDTMVDGSVRTRLSKVRAEMVAQRLGSEMFEGN